VASHVLLVDDRPEDLELVEAAFATQTSVDLKHPQDVTEEDLARATVVLVDYELHHWGERDDLPSASLQPLNGVALAATYRSFAKERIDRPMAIALYSGKLSELGPIPSETRPHVLATLGGIQWVFPKADPDPAAGSASVAALVRSALSLGAAVEGLPHAWPVGVEDVRRQVGELLHLAPESDPEERLWHDVARCWPPMYEMSTASHGMWFLDWMLHQILPYPTFLLDKMTLAARLRFQPEALDEVLQGDTPVAHQLRVLEYGGILSDFLGSRWWAAGVSSFIKGLRSDPDSDLGSLIARMSGVEGASPLDQPVVCYDKKIGQLGALYDESRAVRIFPDLWPVFADPAHAPKDLLADPAINELSKRAAGMIVVRTPQDGSLS